MGPHRPEEPRSRPLGTTEAEIESLPADGEVVALYLTDFAPDHKASTVVRRVVGIAKGHRRAGHLSP
ncbi:MAG: hypothetical protein Q8K72_20715, partial [Acidimicrobiales bacterium]|nr:hypothetical protein [Acidimicrobiales bacterium]